MPAALPAMGATSASMNATSASMGATSGIIGSTGVLPDSSSIIAVLLQHQVDQSMSGLAEHYETQKPQNGDAQEITPFETAIELGEPPYDFDWIAVDDDDDSAALF
jgi:hypothetical protein